MDNPLYRIEPNEGIGDVRFGDSTERLQNLLGSPDEIENFDQATTYWRYRVLKLRFAFLTADWPSTNQYKRLAHFMTRHSETTLWGKRIIGRPKNQVLRLFGERGCTDFAESEEIMESISYTTVRLEQLHVVLDFSQGLLQGLLWATRD